MSGAKLRSGERNESFNDVLYSPDYEVGGTRSEATKTFLDTGNLRGTVVFTNKFPTKAD